MKHGRNLVHEAFFLAAFFLSVFFTRPVFEVIERLAISLAYAGLFTRYFECVPGRGDHRDRPFVRVVQLSDLVVVQTDERQIDPPGREMSLEVVDHGLPLGPDGLEVRFGLAKPLQSSRQREQRLLLRRGAELLDLSEPELEPPHDAAFPATLPSSASVSAMVRPWPVR